MAGPSPVVVTFGADTAGIKAGAAEAAKAVAGFGASANTTGKQLSQFKEGMGRARETAMFFTQALGEFGPQGRTAQIALSGIAGAIMGGGGILLALSLAQTAVRLLVDAWQEEAKAAEEAAKERDEAARREAELAINRLRVVGDALTDYRIQNRALTAELAGVNKETIEYREQVAKLRSELLLLTGAQRATAELRLAEIERLFHENQELRSNIALRKAAKEAAAEDQKQREALSGGMASAAIEPSSVALPAAQANTPVLISLSQMRTAAYLEEATAAQLIGVQLHASAEEAMAMGEAMLQGLARDAVAAFRPMLTSSAAYTRAMRAAGKQVEDTSDLSGPAFAAMAQNALAGLAIEAATRALFYTAEGISLAATPATAAMAVPKFIAAGIMAGIAGAAGGGAYAIGQSRGMTAAERAQVEGGGGGGTGAGGVGSFSSGTTGGESIVRETRIVFVNGLMTEAEAAQYAVRADAAARRLDMHRREA